MTKIRKLNIVFALIYYFFGIIGFYFLFILGITSGFMDLKYLCLILFIILPVMILLLPIVIKKLLKKNFYKCILFSLIGVIVYFIILCAVLYFISTFSESKWKNNKYINLRYLMIEDLEEKYDFIGMNKREVIKILGDESFDDNELCYKTSSVMISEYFYCLKYNEKNIVTETYEKYVD